MKSLVAILLLACTVYGSPVLETPEVASARAAHNAAHATARALNALPPAASPIYLEQAVQDTPEVWAARAEHYKAYATAAAANGVVASLPSLQPYYFQAIPDTPEVWEAKQAHFRAHAAARG
ncbi:cuticle protein 2-like [Daphnia pulex]|uniref:cuticle protein 2-like n=1 Tax=Daphnia pulex TaxID=6669 RepID=UPI001EDCB3DF|nr:cuticle protein 2-like [Daphnia pulex]